MFMKQYNYKPRSNSTSSTGSGSGVAAGSPPKEEAKPATVAAGTTAGGATSAAVGAAGRRRSSAAGADKFAGLAAHKRGSQDGAVAAKKASWEDQKAGTGILGGMWNSFTKGS